MGVLAVLSARVQANPFNLSYSGRLVSSSGQPIKGPVDIEVRFFDQATGGTQLGPTKFTQDVNLNDGVFSLDLSLDATEQAAVFGSGSEVWIQITDVTNDKVYARQRFNAAPFALRVPVDGSTLSWNANGELEVVQLPDVGLPSLDISDGGGNKVTITAPPLASDYTFFHRHPATSATC